MRNTADLFNPSQIYDTISPEGIKYVGTFNREGQPHGEGTMTYPDKKVFMGKFVNGRITEGEITYPDKSLYRGTFKDGMYSGQGILTTAERVYEGIFEKGEFVKGKMIARKDGTIYENCTFKNGMPNGSGIIRDPNGLVYKGQIIKGCGHGKGTLTLPDGTVMSGNFVNGDLGDAGAEKSIFSSFVSLESISINPMPETTLSAFQEIFGKSANCTERE